MYRNLLCFVGLVFFTFSCGLMGPEPDKRITATIEVLDYGFGETAMQETISAIENRFIRYGVVPLITEDLTSMRLNFSLETNVSEDRILKILTTKGKLEFFEVLKKEEMMPFLLAADDMEASQAIDEVDALLGNADSEKNEEEIHPLLSKFQPIEDYGGMFAVMAKDTAFVNSLLKKPGIVNLLGRNKKTTKFLWGVKPKGDGAFTLYAVRVPKSGKALIDGRLVSDAQQNFSMTDEPSVGIRMNEEGAAAWERLTQDASDEMYLIAIVLDDFVYTAPGVHGPIIGGRSEITGNFTLEEATDLAAMIAAGAMPDIKVLSFDVAPLK